jgi:hypothetical protein
VNPSNVPVPTYNWTVTNGTNMTGQGTNSISVTWGTTGIPSSGPVNVNASNACGASGTKSKTFSTSCREELNNDQDVPVTVYPNPAHDKLTTGIFVKDQTQLMISFHDLSGRIIFSEKFEAMPGMNAYESDLKNFAKGLYILELNSEGISYKIKVVVE